MGLSRNISTHFFIEREELERLGVRQTDLVRPSDIYRRFPRDRFRSFTWPLPSERLRPAYDALSNDPAYVKLELSYSGP